MEIEIAQSTNIGRIRKQNEDAVGYWAPDSRALKRSHGYLLALADGVGGHAHGEVASALAIETLVADFPATPSDSNSSTILEAMMSHANARIVAQAEQLDAAGPAMATTLVTCILRSDQCHFAHLGDSRLYQIRPQKSRPSVLQLTQDHTAANDPTLRSIPAAMRKHILTRSLGRETFVPPDTGFIPVEPGDIVLLASDGVHGALSDRRIAAICTANATVDEIAKKLTDEATRSDGGDNATVLVARIKSIEHVGLYRGRTYHMPTS